MTDYKPARSHLVSYSLSGVDGSFRALVLSPKAYNVDTGFCICCAVADSSVGYPFEVASSVISPAVVLSDQVFHLPWRESSLTFIGKFPKGKTRAVTDRLVMLL